MKEEILRFSFRRTGVHPVREQVFPHFFWSKEGRVSSRVYFQLQTEKYGGGDVTRSGPSPPFQYLFYCRGRNRHQKEDVSVCCTVFIF